jgi:hypothetical protein
MAEPIGLDRGAFRPSYRPEKRQAGMDPELKRMGVMAAGIGGALAFLLAGAWLIRPAHHGLPVVEADAGPVRVKPVNPGGEQFIGQDFGGGPSVNGPHLAPAAEQPELSALHAQMRDMKKLMAKQAAVNAEALKLAQLAAARNRVAAPAPVQHASATAIVPAVQSALPKMAEAPPIATAGGTDVQFAAFTDAAAAHTEWDALMQKTPELLGGRKPEIIRADAGGRTMWRLRTGGFATVAEAASFCAKMRARGADCSIAAF